MADLIEEYNADRRQRTATRRPGPSSFVSDHTLDGEPPTPLTSQGQLMSSSAPTSPSKSGSTTAGSDRKSKATLTCLDGQVHYFRDFPYCNLALRPSGWQPDTFNSIYFISAPNSVTALFRAGCLKCKASIPDNMPNPPISSLFWTRRWQVVPCAARECVNSRDIRPLELPNGKNHYCRSFQVTFTSSDGGIYTLVKKPFQFLAAMSYTALLSRFANASYYTLVLDESLAVRPLLI